MTAEKNICADCVGDYALAVVVTENADADLCTYCEAEGENIAAPVGAISDHIAMCLTEEWTDPVDELMWIGREGGYQGTVLDSWEVLQEAGFDPPVAELFDDVVAGIVDRQWCKRDYALMSASDRQRSGWDAFAMTVKHGRRYTFWADDGSDEGFSHPDDTPMSTVLPELLDSLRRAAVVRRIGQGSVVHRVRVHGLDERPKIATELGAPPLRFARQPNRMSPAGISMFYGATDLETAWLETVEADRTDHLVTTCMFTAVRDLMLLDITELPEAPSCFDYGKSSTRHAIYFLRDFVDAIAAPIARNESGDIDYVPTQIFTEYIRFEASKELGKQIDGICYPSARNGRKCYVIFADNDQCCGPGSSEGLLRLEPDSLQLFAVGPTPTTPAE